MILHNPNFLLDFLTCNCFYIKEISLLCGIINVSLYLYYGDVSVKLEVIVLDNKK